MNRSVPNVPPPRLYNTARRSVVPLVLDPERDVTIYTCGPTVYRPVHLGNLSSFVLADSLKRLLLALGYGVRHVKNITDVGHMRQELLERGEDKVVAEAVRAGLTPADIAQGFTDEFLRDEQRMGILAADVFPRATQHVERMVEITSALLSAGRATSAQATCTFAYRALTGMGNWVAPCRAK